VRFKAIASGFASIVFATFHPAIADAASCGTVAAPTACSVELSGGAVFTVSDFTLVNANSAGGANLYQASDIAIDLIAAPADQARLTFSKNAAGPTPGTVFFVNDGETSSFIVSYTIALDPVDAGAAVAFVGVTNTIQASSLANGSSVVQLIFPGEPNCLATTTSSTTNCALSGADSYEPGIIATLSGNTGNTSILTIRNIFQVTVPEPATGGAMLTSVATLARLRRTRHRTRSVHSR
jgi:hypothetical protein